MFELFDAAVGHISSCLSCHLGKTVIHCQVRLMWNSFCRHQIQHYTNQLAKETSQKLKDLVAIPQSVAPSEQVCPVC